MAEHVFEAANHLHCLQGTKCAVTVTKESKAKVAEDETSALEFKFVLACGWVNDDVLWNLHCDGR